MFKKILVLGVTLIMGLGLFSGCNSGRWFNVSHGDKGAIFEREVDGESKCFVGTRTIKSLNELKAFFDEWNHPAFDEGAQGYSSDFSKKIRAYDDIFFADKALVVCSLTASNMGISYTIQSITTEGDNLIINIKRKESKWESAAEITPWTFLIKVKKADIFDITGAQFKF